MKSVCQFLTKIKKPSGVFDYTGIRPVDQFGRMSILVVVSLLIYKHGRDPDLCRSSLVSSLEFSVTPTHFAIFYDLI